MGRELAVGVVAFAAGLAVGLLLRGDGADPRTDAAVAKPAPELDADVRRETSRRAHAPPKVEAPAPVVVSEAPPVPLSADVREIPLADSPTGWADVDVEVVDAEGRAAENASVYALAVGAPGAEYESSVPHGSTDAAGRCRLRLSAPGVFDVAAWREGALGRALDVSVPRAAGVHVALPSSATVVFGVDPGAPVDRQIGLTIQVPGSRCCPARGEPGTGGNWSTGVAVGAGVQSASIELPVGTRFTVTPRGAADVAPSEVVAPAKVVVRSTATGGPAPRPLKVNVKLTVRDELWSRSRSVRVALDFGGEASETEWWLPSVGLEFTQLVRVAAGKLSWSGPTIEPGSTTWDLDAADAVLMDVVVRDPPPDAARAVRVLVDMPREHAPQDGRVGAYFELAGYPSGTSDGGLVVGTETTIDPHGDWMLVDAGPYGGDGDHRYVAGPVRLRRGERQVVRPRVGGYVVFTPSGMPPEAAGEVTIARADGAPFGVAASNDRDVRYVRRCAVFPGSVLGPFEPGPVTLDVSVGGVRRGRYEVVVREDAFVPLAALRLTRQ